MNALTRVAHLPSEQWVGVLLSANLIVVFAFLAIFHLLTTSEDQMSATASDYWLVGAVVGFTFLTGFVGLSIDIPLIMGGVAAYYLLASTRIADKAFLALVYCALMVNGFLAPLIFQMFKPFFLSGEVHLAAMLNNQLGLDIVAEGVLIHTNNGVKLQMVGGCSVFMNLSFAFLGYAAIKGFTRSPFRSSDWCIVGILMIALIVGNSIRLGLMSLSFPSYEYWHHGDGAAIFGFLQFAGIVLISSLPFVCWQRS